MKFPTKAAFNEGFKVVQISFKKLSVNRIRGCCIYNAYISMFFFSDINVVFFKKILNVYYHICDQLENLQAKSEGLHSNSKTPGDCLFNC